MQSRQLPTAMLYTCSKTRNGSDTFRAIDFYDPILSDTIPLLLLSKILPSLILSLCMLTAEPSVHRGVLHPAPNDRRAGGQHLPGGGEQHNCSYNHIRIAVFAQGWTTVTALLR